MTRKEVKSVRLRIMRERRKLSAEERKLQAACTHPAASRRYRSDTGNVCLEDDYYWLEIDCPDCGFFEIIDSTDPRYRCTRS